MAAPSDIKHGVLNQIFTESVNNTQKEKFGKKSALRVYHRRN